MTHFHCNHEPNTLFESPVITISPFQLKFTWKVNGELANKTFPDQWKPLITFKIKS